MRNRRKVKAQVMRNGHHYTWAQGGAWRPGNWQLVTVALPPRLISEAANLQPRCFINQGWLRVLASTLHVKDFLL